MIILGAEILRYVYDEQGINITLQAAGSVITNAFIDLSTKGCPIRSGDETDSQSMLNMFFLRGEVG